MILRFALPQTPFLKDTCLSLPHVKLVPSLLPLYECTQTILEPHSGFCVFLMGLDLLNVLRWPLKPQPLGVGAVHLRLKLEGVDFHPSTAACHLCDEGRLLSSTAVSHVLCKNFDSPFSAGTRDSSTAKCMFYI